MKKKYYADALKCGILAATALAFLIFAIALFCVASYYPAIACLLLCGLYGYAAALNGVQIEIHADGIRRRFLCFPARETSWREIREVGVCGSKLWRGPGTLYLYLSTERLTEEERFRMVLRWPPKQIWLRYKADRLNALLPFWTEKIVLYNAGDLTL